MRALEIEDTERSRSSEMDTQADRMLASISRSSTAEDMAQATAPQAANEATLSPFGVLIQRFCELLDAVDLPRHALDGLERLIETDKAGHTAPGGALEHTIKKDLSPESQLELAEIVKWAFPIVQNMEARIARFCLLTRSQEDMKALILDNKLLTAAEPYFIVDVEEVNSMLARMAGWANKGISAASLHSRVLDSMGQVAGASQASKE
ncbi:hypothetical protein K523DRAFT_249096 [Schizophyllum commune Tattone D]|nr:hypothetical protein K523DRAFT_249096 [Schizophyllum commune Tattone D]